MTSRCVDREMEDIDQAVLPYSQVKALATGNSLIIERIGLDEGIKKLKFLKSSYLIARKTWKISRGINFL